MTDAWLDAILLRYVNLPFGRDEAIACRDAIVAELSGRVHVIAGLEPAPAPAGPEPRPILPLPGEAPYPFPEGHVPCGFCQDHGYTEGLRAGLAGTPPVGVGTLRDALAFHQPAPVTGSGDTGEAVVSIGCTCGAGGDDWVLHVLEAAR